MTASNSWPLVSWFEKEIKKITSPPSNKPQSVQPIRKFLQMESKAPPAFRAYKGEWSEPSMEAPLSAEISSVITIKLTLKWKRLDVWYSAVKRVSITSYPNRDGDGSLLNWSRKEREVFGLYFAVNLSGPYKVIPGATLEQCSLVLVFSTKLLIS